MNGLKWGLAGSCGLIVAGMWTALSATSAQERVTPIPVRSDDAEPAPQAVRPLMQAKLSNSQRVLEGLVLHDYERMATAAAALKNMSLAAPAAWDLSDNDKEVYEHFRIEFMRQSSSLERMARDEHLEGAAYYQQLLTATCIACHDYIRDYQPAQNAAADAAPDRK